MIALLTRPGATDLYSGAEAGGTGVGGQPWLLETLTPIQQQSISNTLVVSSFLFWLHFKKFYIYVCIYGGACISATYHLLLTCVLWGWIEFRLSSLESGALRFPLYLLKKSPTQDPGYIRGKDRIGFGLTSVGVPEAKTKKKV